MSRINFKSSKKSNFLLTLTLALVIAVIAGVLFIGNYITEKQSCYVDDAVFDLSGVDFDAGQRVSLNGQWEFYYNSLIVSGGVKQYSPTAYLRVPHSWSSVINEAGTYESGGFASYRCKLINAESSRYLIAYIPNIASAYRIYINGALVCASGIVSDNSNEIWSEASHDSLPFLLEKGKAYELVVEVAAQNNSGVYMPVYLANYSAENSLSNSILAWRNVLSGIVLFCAVLFIILKYSVNKELYSLWLPVLSFVLVIRTLITNESFIVTQALLADVSFEDMFVFTFVSTYIIKLISLIYIAKCLNLKINDNVFVAFSVVFLGVAISLNYLPNSIFDTYYYVILQILSAIIDIFIINRLCIEMCEKKENSFLYLLSYLFITVGISVDTLYSNGIILFPCSAFLPVCFAAFTVITVMIHARRIKKIHDCALEAKQLERELDLANTALMISQIQPHFLYNALNTIKSLIRRNPEKAESAVIDFSLYLRGNMDSLTRIDPIPISEELDHVKYYCNIEQLRFSDKLEMFYEIECTDFYVPTLSVQPIVENAIKHGVTKKPEGGYVTVSTYEDDKNYYIKVEDDGVGFDVNAPLTDNKKSHVGIENTRSRFESIMGGELDIQSEVGKGTTVTVTLPKDKNVSTLQESLMSINTQALIKEMNI